MNLGFIGGGLNLNIDSLLWVYITFSWLPNLDVYIKQLGNACNENS